MIARLLSALSWLPSLSCHRQRAVKVRQWRGGERHGSANSRQTHAPERRRFGFVRSTTSRDRRDDHCGDAIIAAPAAILELAAALSGATFHRRSCGGFASPTK